MAHHNIDHKPAARDEMAPVINCILQSGGPPQKSGYPGQIVVEGWRRIPGFSNYIVSTEGRGRCSGLW
jgi:hypothetical protein